MTFDPPTAPIFDYSGHFLRSARDLYYRIVPGLVAVLPFFLIPEPHNNRFHLVGTLLVGALMIGSFFWGFRLHRRWKILALLSIGLGLVLFNLHTVPGNEFVVTAGAVLLGLGHIRNQYFSRVCKRDKE
jgi:hypothetical protein